jgi:ABC-type nitrate/sulfonate/bicarbonate transport system substrate-binding protein
MPKIRRLFLILSLLGVWIVGGTLGHVLRCAAAENVPIRILRSATAPAEYELADRLSGGHILQTEGVNLVEISGSGSAGWLPMMVLMTDRVDVAGGGWPGWINARARGGKIKAVLVGGSSYHFWPERKAGLLVLENSPIRTVKDLAGKTIAVNVLGLTGDYIVKLMLKQNGVPLDQVQIIAVPQENQEQVLRSRQVHAIADTTTGGPNFERILERGGVRIIPGTGKYEVFGEDEITGTGFREDFLAKHPETVTRYVTAVEKSRRIIWKYFQENPQHVREVYAELLKEKGGNPQLAKYYVPPIYLPAYEFITGRETQKWIALFEAEGRLKPGQVKAADVFTNDFNPFYKEYLKHKGAIR